MSGMFFETQCTPINRSVYLLTAGLKTERQCQKDADNVCTNDKYQHETDAS